MGPFPPFAFWIGPCDRGSIGPCHVLEYRCGPVEVWWHALSATRCGPVTRRGSISPLDGAAGHVATSLARRCVVVSGTCCAAGAASGCEARHAGGGHQSWMDAERWGRGGRYYIVMELLVGGALLDRILDSPNRQFSEHQALDIMKQAARARTPVHIRAPAHPGRVHAPMHLAHRQYSTTTAYSPTCSRARSRIHEARRIFKIWRTHGEVPHALKARITNALADRNQR
jgi:hypothetical protein